MTNGKDVLSIGRISVDIYPNDVGIDLEDVHSFGKYLGGSPSNVAVAVARYGHTADLVTKTGDDPFGTFLHRELTRYGVDDRFVATDARYPTPVAFCAIKPPEDFPLYFYRTPTAPDLQIRPEELDAEAVRQARILWLSVTGLCQEPSRSTHIRAVELRGVAHSDEGRYTVLDLDYRDMFWDSAEDATDAIAEVLPRATVAIGNRAECAVAVGAGEPDDMADRMLDRGVEIAVVKLGSEGVMAKTRTERVVSPPITVTTVNGLGAGDAFGGAFCHGLLEGWSLARTLDFANAAGAYVATQIACSDAMPTEDDVLNLLGDHVESETQYVPGTRAIR